MTTTKTQRPWYAHEFPDRPLSAGAHLCCCIPCAVSLERCAREDSRRHVYVHTGRGVMTHYAAYLGHRRDAGQFHDMFHYMDGPRINWITDIEVGPRQGRPTRDRLCDEDAPYPKPLMDWRVCWHCGPLSSATFPDLVPVGKKRRPSAKEFAEHERNQGLRTELEARVLIALDQQIDRAALELELHWARLDAGNYEFDDSPDEYGRRFGY